MNVRLSSLVLAGCVAVLASCGSDDDSSSGRSKLVDQAISFAEDNGLTADKDCLTSLFDKLPDSDVDKLVDAGLDGDPDLSDEGDAVGDGLAACLAAAPGS
jgi:hypothetical protein